MKKPTLFFAVFISAVFSMACSLQKQNQSSDYANAVKTINHDDLDLGKSSLSLNVKDIKKSFAFYQMLGFQTIEGGGSLEQNWMVLSNGNTKIGLFQGMFPTNTLTFNPKDARKIFKEIKLHGIEPIFSAGLDQPSGPCTFSITDPDGNPILFDQH